MSPRTNPGAPRPLRAPSRRGTEQKWGQAALVGVSALTSVLSETDLPASCHPSRSCFLSAPELHPPGRGLPSPGTHWVYVGDLGLPEFQFFIAVVTTERFCMLSRQTSATGMTHQDTEFSAVYLLFNGEEPGAGESGLEEGER